MQLPNPQQVKNIVGHLGTGVGTAIVIFGLQAKGFDPVKVTAAINALGDLVNNLVIVVATIGAIVAAYKSATGSSTPNVIAQGSQAISANPIAVAATLSPEVKVELAKASVDMAATSDTSNKALLENVVRLNNVQGVVTDVRTSLATESPLVTSNPADIPRAAA